VENAAGMLPRGMHPFPCDNILSWRVLFGSFLMAHKVLLSPPIKRTESAIIRSKLLNFT
jgi:hypothetical protein